MHAWKHYYYKKKIGGVMKWASEAVGLVARLG